MIEWTRINGSLAIRAVGVDRGGSDTKPRLYVQFKRSKKIYVYEPGNTAYYDRFVAAASKGKYYVRVIKAKFDYVAKY